MDRPTRPSLRGVNVGNGVTAWQVGVPSILGFGFKRQEHRQKYGRLVKQAQFAAKLHVLNVDASGRWKRIEARNTNQGDSFHMEITRGMFDYIETT